MTADPGLKHALLRKSTLLSRVSRYVDTVPILSLFDRTATCVVTGHNEKPKAQEKKEK